MSYYNSFIECYNAWQILALNSEQASDVVGIGSGWKPQKLQGDLSYYDYTTMTSQKVASWYSSYSPKIYISYTDVDEMTNDNTKFREFIFANKTAIRFRITGTTGERLNFNIWIENLVTGVTTSVISISLVVTYDILKSYETSGYIPSPGVNITSDNFFVTPYFSLMIDSFADPTWKWRDCGLAFTSDKSINWLITGSPNYGIRIDDGVFSATTEFHSGDYYYEYANIFNENNWSGVPDWFWNENQAEVSPEYPEEDDSEGDEGGYPTDDFGSDIIPIPEFPTVSALGTELINIYLPTSSEVQNFSTWLWSSNYESNVKKLQTSPMENLITFGFVPDGSTSTAIGKVADTIHIGGIDSEVDSNHASTQYIEIDCGHIDVGEVHGSYLDYDTEFQIYLPYIGYKPLKADDVLPHGIDVKYHMDILTGIVQAYITGYVKDKTDNTYKLSLLYSYVGNCFTELPISGANYTRMKQGQMNAIVGTVASFGTNVVKGNLFGALGSVIQGKQQYDLQRPDFEHGGGLAGNVLFTFRKPYVIRTAYDYIPVKNYKSYKGVPCVTYHTLNKLQGFTQIDTVVVDTLTHCTKEEKEEIVRQLKEGVII